MRLHPQFIRRGRRLEKKKKLSIHNYPFVSMLPLPAMAANLDQLSASSAHSSLALILQGRKARDLLGKIDSPELSQLEVSIPFAVMNRKHKELISHRITT